MHRAMAVSRRATSALQDSQDISGHAFVECLAETNLLALGILDQLAAALLQSFELADLVCFWRAFWQTQP